MLEMSKKKGALVFNILRVCNLKIHKHFTLLLHIDPKFQIPALKKEHISILKFNTITYAGPLKNICFRVSMEELTKENDMIK